MACEVCQHCYSPVTCHENFSVRDGFSYHEKCHKCYVCSETNLQEAVVFKGVIFCSSCSERMFQGCATARRSKNNRNTRNKSRRQRSPRTKDKYAKESRNGILELAALNVSTDSSNTGSSNSKFKKSKSLTISTELALKVGKEVFYDTHKPKKLKTNSAEIGMTTEVTQQLLEQMNCPVVKDYKKPEKLAKSAPKTHFRYTKTPCSDLRIAELGASTEIANMALRHKSELPVIIKPETRVKPMSSRSESYMDRESADSGELRDDWIDSAYSQPEPEEPTRTHWMDRRLGSILKLPYNAFRRNIIERSPHVSVSISIKDKETLIKKIKELFREEISDHQQKGLKKLYSTINRKNTPNKLGWLGRANHDQKRCKHFRASHSYRCMRAQVMRLAGPTKSELAVFRNRVKNVISPGFLRTIALNNRRFPAIMMSQACGNSKGESSNMASK